VIATALDRAALGRGLGLILAVRCSTRVAAGAGASGSRRTSAAGGDL